jgi:hypothetical protein
VNPEAWGLKTTCDVSANRRLPLDHRLTRKDNHGIIAPVRNNFIDIFASGSEISPLRIPAE